MVNVNTPLKSMMKINPLPFGLAGSLIIGTFASPLAAQAQFSPLQNATQNATIRGNNNTINQEINQTIIFRPGAFGLGGYKNNPFSPGKYTKKLKKIEKKAEKQYKKWEREEVNERYKDWKDHWHRDYDDDDHDD